MPKMSPLAERLSLVRQRIAAAAEKAGRRPAEITLVAVTKEAAPEQIREILQYGVGDLGENRVQILTQRVGQFNEFFQRRQKAGDASGLAARLRWHMVGHLQRNKVKGVLPLVDVIHSVDSLRLAEEIEAQAGKLEKKIPVLLQLNASEEASKSGVAVGAALHLAEQIHMMSHMVLVGLMTMAPLGASPEQAHFVFSRTREVFDEIKWNKIGGNGFRHLSMGMSGDFEAAIAEGATIVRIGTAIFGRKAPDPDRPERDEADEKR